MIRLLTLFVLLLVAAVPVFADIGPATYQDGSGIGPDQPTQVRMEMEVVTIDLFPAVDQDGWDNSFAIVDALFSMRNLGSAPEDLRVKFPVSTGSNAIMSGDHIKGLQVWLASTEMDITYGDEPFDESTGITATERWAYFDASFPPAEQVQVRVRYILEPALDSDGHQRYSYILATGSGWQGTIGQAEIIVRFPYAVDSSSVFQYPEGGRWEGSELTWVKQDFEPSEADDFYLHVRSPVEVLSPAEIPVLPSEDMVSNLLGLQMALEDDPQNGFAWLFLGDYYERLAYAAMPGLEQGSAPFSPVFTEMGLSAYNRAVQLNPQSRGPAIGTARLLLLNKGKPLNAQVQAEVLDWYQQALNLSPYEDAYFAQIEDQKLLELSQALGLEPPPLAVTLTATAAPAATDTPTPGPTITRTSTVQPAVTHTSAVLGQAATQETGTAAAQNGTPLNRVTRAPVTRIVGLGAVVLMLIVLYILLRRK